MTEDKEYKLKRGLKFAVTIAFAALLGVLLGHIVSSYELRFMLNREYCGNYRGISVYKSGTINADNFIEHAYVLADAPDELVECCDRMYFTGTDLEIPANDSGYGSALGLTQNRTVYISTESFSQDVVLHELFHAYDNAHGTLSSNSWEFKDAFESENSYFHIIAGNESLYASEYFAQSGAMYLISPYELLARAPKTYSYFDKLFGSEERVRSIIGE